MTEFKPYQVKRIAYNAVNRDLRGQVVSIVGMRGASHWDSPRVVVRLVNNDGSLGAEYLVLPSVIIDL